MKVCAHINYGPFNNGHERFDSIAEAVEYFRSKVAGVDYGTGLGSREYGDEQNMDLYPQCSDCSSGMCFHDYPMVRYAVGPRGGIRKESV